MFVASTEIAQRCLVNSTVGPVEEGRQLFPRTVCVHGEQWQGERLDRSWPVVGGRDRARALSAKLIKVRDEA